MKYIIHTDNMGLSYANANSIARTFNQSSRISKWECISDTNLWMVDATEGTQITDIRDLVTAAAPRASVLVMPFNGVYASSLSKHTNEKLQNWSP